MLQAEVGILPKEAGVEAAFKAPILNRAGTLAALTLGHLRASHVVARTWDPIKDRTEVSHRTLTRLTKLLEAQL